MTKIHKLSSELTNQIAAGEVIERPASVIKELCENALDAGSTRIKIDFIDAGLKQIMVQDNGSGIAADEIDLAFMRHATSKINTNHDLFNIATLGFRGEALASIAAVAKVDIVTSTGGVNGIHAIFEDGNKVKQEAIASPQGTKIVVKDLFYNTPARLKYLKSERTEIMKIVDIVNRLALGYPQVSFELTNQQKQLLKTTGHDDLRQTAANIYGIKVAEKMLAIYAQSPDFKIAGLISRADDIRSTRNFITLLLNTRYVKNYRLVQAIVDGYGTRLLKGRYPFAIVKIDLDPLLVDVNVHPTKQEVRLSKESELARLIVRTIDQVLGATEHEIASLDNATESKQTKLDQLEFNLNEAVVDTSRIPVEFSMPNDLTDDSSKIKEDDTTFVSLKHPRQDEHYLVTTTWDENVQAQTALSPFSASQLSSEVTTSSEQILVNRLPQLQCLGQMHEYLLATADNDLYIVDQVAADNRLAFDKLLLQMQAENNYEQTLLDNIILDFSMIDFLKVQDKLADFKQLGLNLEEFGGRSFVLQEYPLWLENCDQLQIKAVIDLILAHINAPIDKIRIELAKKIVATKHIRRKSLNSLEMVEMLTSLSNSSNPYHDPFGKIIIAKISENDLRKLFQK
ncbi:MAG: DNA mismatch repair endonuclease MutL [Lactobacillus iners]|jgi:DNA mismatch repair protein MutL|uniref:DNA mismatch repair endonuclease MutL n=1 Tax=Lactobacillus iners TaxID=147802 RepID=UPI001F0928D7|nr:DNA mismatch repair endonuclease MutL [Lactobacillus iners]MCT7739426.1 DNA mismatch repair endonuclease MutL [Lactobacillus iners]MCT7747385.1 DNA mismatch repair endonuclease MutL [Lactobacillus iners]MCT7814779.1 DNA mismatch repair endonuclease MutL [Lactobacillus iners]MCT7835087.1 DNA mismatch repair endonuclease MutL [Lactobacillus iners]MCT7837007.1 DNA mismatch repair endonuclease MutL [Lactobacillus iners]